jgi:hypothetical protein
MQALLFSNGYLFNPDFAVAAKSAQRAEEY